MLQLLFVVHERKDKVSVQQLSFEPWELILHRIAHLRALLSSHYSKSAVLFNSMVHLLRCATLVLRYRVTPCCGVTNHMHRSVNIAIAP